MSSSTLALSFVNQTGLSDDSVFVSFQNGAKGYTGFQMTYGAGTPVSIGATDLMSTPLSLTTIGSGGLTVDQAISILVYVSYGQALQSTTSAPAFIGSGTDFGTQFQNFEITMSGSPGDQGDMTAINYFTAPMRIQSFDANGNLLQSVGYNLDANAIAAQLGETASPIWANLVTDSQGYRVRLIGPSSYGGSMVAPYPSFIPYLQSVNTAGQTTRIVNSNGFIADNKTKTTYLFTLDHKATAESDGTVRIKGQITTTITDGTSHPGPTFTDCNMTLSASDASNFNAAIYGQIINGAVTFDGDGWVTMAKQLQEWDVVASALATTQNLLIGEITTGILLGLVNSDTIPSGQTLALKDMASNQWWSLSPLPAFALAQPDNAYYNPYAAVLFAASNNQVYSIPYSDRLGQGPLVQSVSYQGTAVASWVVTLYPPLATPA